MLDDTEMDDGIEYIALYHDTPEGQEHECRFRNTVEMLLSQPDPEEMLANPNMLVAIPASNDFLGIFQGGVELTVTFKPFGECTMDEADRIRVSHWNYAALLRVEADFYSEMGDVPEDDKTLPVPGYKEKLKAFRSGVREAVEERIARIRANPNAEEEGYQ